MSNIKPIKFTNPNYNLINTINKNNTTDAPEKININVSKIGETFIDTIKDFFSDNNEAAYEKNMSDKESLNLNKIGAFINELENNLTNEELNNVINYYQGKGINEIIDENGNLKPIILDNVDTNDINNKIKNINIDGHKTILDCKISEIVCDSSGYTAIVLVNSNGDYYINSAETNPNSETDLSSITFSLFNYLFDDTLAKYLPSFFFPSTNSNYNNAEDIYNSQLNASYKLIKKYSKKAEEENKKVNLFGFSLGGGITTTVYSLMKIKDEKLTDNINSVSVYNPWIALAEGYNEFKPYLNVNNDNLTFKNFLLGWLSTRNPLSSIIYLVVPNTKAGFKINAKSLMTAISDDEKVTIYSAESDIVSTLNDYYSILKDRFKFIPAKKPSFDLQDTDLNEGNIIHNTFRDTWNSLWNGEGFDLIDNAKNNVMSNVDRLQEATSNNIMQLVDLIFFGLGNHGLGCISDDLFDDNGNMIKIGEYQNINDLFAKLFNKKYSGNNESVDLPFLINTILNGVLPTDSILQYKDIILENVDIGDIDISSVDFEKILNYIINNAGDFSKNEFLDIVADEFSNWLCSKDGIKFISSKLDSKVPNDELIKFMLDYALEDAKIQKDLVDTFAKIIKNQDNFDIVMQSLLMIYKGNTQLGTQTLTTMILDDFEVLKKDLVDIVCNTLEDFINQENVQNLIIEKADNFWITLSIDKLEVGDNIISGFKEILQNNDYMVDNLINKIRENPEIIKKPEKLVKEMIKIVEPKIVWKDQFWLWIASKVL